MLNKYGKIESIKEVCIRDEEEWFGGLSGYKVSTDKVDLYVLINDFQYCCEEWGYIASEDEEDLKYYIDSELLGIELTDVALNNKMVNFINKTYMEEDAIQFVTFITDNGVFQLAVYNQHNGYYGHDIVIKCHFKENNLENVLLKTTL